MDQRRRMSWVSKRTRMSYSDVQHYQVRTRYLCPQNSPVSLLLRWSVPLASPVSSWLWKSCETRNPQYNKAVDVNYRLHNVLSLPLIHNLHNFALVSKKSHAGRPFFRANSTGFRFVLNERYASPSRHESNLPEAFIPSEYRRQGLNIVAVW